MRLFNITFQLSKTEIYEVSIKTIKMYDPATKTHYTDGVEFSHMVDVFCRSKKGFTRCGQIQNEVTKNYKTARQFCEKWEPKHIKKITDEEYNEIVSDLETLKQAYNYVEWESKDGWQSVPFYKLQELSKLPMKKN